MRSLIILIFLLCTAIIASAATGQRIGYTVNGTDYEGYFIIPSVNAPLVLLVHDWDGLTDYEIKRAEMLADLGYAVFAADLFGKGVRPTAMEDKKKLTGDLYQNRKKMRELLEAALATARKNGITSSQAVAVGYCFGGAAVLEMARSGADLKGFVTFHGGLTTPAGQDYSKTKGQVLILHGTADESVSMNDFALLAQDLEKAHVSHEMITYSGAPHAFTVFNSERYREDADKKSWRRFTEFLADTLHSEDNAQ
ncbi:MAG: dienelactone hydrolase family protein [Desulfoprunum sp.]|nr:dienelactone hydrolase family protein [Desulfoprunum sp.]